MRAQLKKIKNKKFQRCGAVPPASAMRPGVRLTGPALEARSPLAMTRMEVGGDATRVSERKLKVGELWQEACSFSAHSAQQPMAPVLL